MLTSPPELDLEAVLKRAAAFSPSSAKEDATRPSGLRSIDAASAARALPNATPSESITASVGPSVELGDAVPLGPALRPGDLGSMGPYAIEAEIGRGGMGVVFRGFDSALGRLV